ncbi:probable bifunctional methylthioribulose-1-phosphate dehydratase/enolase-phosphatase E1 1 [Dioscorea cayenensis subsp. rotundata]|uniref:Probable bifunctional methylthioribulose-1-phosphate dehydratase/enolase-phosphatase E1 1 n=1 Tax=Dioscorea cayennensis subsp. rotundata TaxID=55577 RepID=A0AB40C2L6_DIOCR|nr:probable bifunctional methylthioribulose-1-phosphate dehydratase/enolase-phosphatase E1 1 [Dioscorea cayenensis subsp. rotundata]
MIGLYLEKRVQDDLEKGISGSVPIPPDDAGKEAVIESLVTNVRAMIAADRKITALKQLQGHIWRTGFQSNELQGVVYEDVPEALKKWHAHGIKVYIYSSGSREAQRLIFRNTTYGDLRKYLCGFFDTTTGNKKEPCSYLEISQSVGVDEPSQVLFLTDVYQEAVAAKAAGLEVIISVRPGNAALPENHGFRTVTSFAEAHLISFG